MAKKNRNHYVPSDGRSAEDRAIERFAELVIGKMETISSDWKKPWFTENTLSWPKNLAGREYNGMNAFLLLLLCEVKGYRMPVFMTFERVRGLNYIKGSIKDGKRLTDDDGNLLPETSVLKGAKSFPVFLTTFTVIHNETKRKISYDDYKKLLKGQQAEYRVYPAQQVYYVFNVEQTNLQETRPELYAKLGEANRALPPEVAADSYCFPAMDEMIKNNEWLCPIHVRHQDEAYYLCAADEIVLPEKTQFYEPEAFYGTGFHEMIHSTGAKGRLDREDDEYAREELVAELGSALVMQRFGLSKTIKKESCAYLKDWLKKLKESPEYIKSILTDVKRATAMVNQKIEAINSRLMETVFQEDTPELLSVTRIPDGATAEFHMMDKESGEAVYDLLHNHLCDKDTGDLVEVWKPDDKVIQIDPSYLDEALECTYDNLDSETMSKIVRCGYYFERHPVEKYGDMLSDMFTREFEKKRNDPVWLKEQGIEGEVKWNLMFVSTDGYHLAKAITENQCRIGAMDHHCSIFRPFTDIGEAFSIENDLGYMTELRRRLLSKDEKVDPLGRITFDADPVRYPDSGTVRRDILIDGDAKAVFVIEPDSDIYRLNFMLELPKNELVKLDSELMTEFIRHDKENDINYTVVDSIYDLFREKDKYYPARVICDGVNVLLSDYLNLAPQDEVTIQEKAGIREEAEMRKKAVLQDEGGVTKKIEYGELEERVEVYSKLFAFKNSDGLWGIQDSKERTVVIPRWRQCRQREDGSVLFNNFVYMNGEEFSHAIRLFQKQELADMGDKFSRLSNVRIEERGEHRERWLAADVDGKPVVSAKVTELDWMEYQGGISSIHELAMRSFSRYFAQPQEEQVRTGMRI